MTTYYFNKNTNKLTTRKSDIKGLTPKKDFEVYDTLDIQYGETRPDLPSYNREASISLAETWSHALGYTNFFNDRGSEAPLRPQMPEIFSHPGQGEGSYRVGDYFHFDAYGSDDASEVRISEMTCARQRYGVCNDSLIEFTRYFETIKDYIEDFLDVDYHICPVHHLPYKVPEHHLSSVPCQWCGKVHSEHGASDNLDIEYWNTVLNHEYLPTEIDV